MSNRKPVMVMAPNFGGASEVWMYRQMIGLTKCEPLVLCEYRSNEDTYPSKNVRVETLPASGRSNHDSNITKLIKAALYSLRNWNWSFRDHPRVAKYINSFVNQYAPKVVLFHFGTTFTRFYPVIRKFRLPVAVHYNGFDMSGALKSPRYKHMFAKYLSNVREHVVVADYMKAALVDLGVHEARIKLIPYGVPCQEFHKSDFTGHEACKFLMAGRLTAKKAPQVSIRAFVACARKNETCTLEVIGAGELQNECAALVKAEGLEDRVTFSGEKPNSYVREAMARSSVFLQHSVTSHRGDKEGWPVAIAEACASGLPVVATRHAGIVNQVVHGETGFLVEEYDLGGMVHYMHELAASAQLRTRLGDAAACHISQWDTSLQIAKLDDLLGTI